MGPHAVNNHYLNFEDFNNFLSTYFEDDAGWMTLRKHEIFRKD